MPEFLVNMVFACRDNLQSGFVHCSQLSLLDFHRIDGFCFAAKQCRQRAQRREPKIRSWNAEPSGWEPEAKGEQRFGCHENIGNLFRGCDQKKWPFVWVWLMRCDCSAVVGLRGFGPSATRRDFCFKYLAFLLGILISQSLMVESFDPCPASVRRKRSSRIVSHCQMSSSCNEIPVFSFVPAAERSEIGGFGRGGVGGTGPAQRHDGVHILRHHHRYCRPASGRSVQSVDLHNQDMKCTAVKLQTSSSLSTVWSTSESWNMNCTVWSTSEFQNLKSRCNWHE